LVVGLAIHSLDPAHCGAGFVPERGAGFVPERGAGFVPEQGAGFVPEPGWWR